MQILKSCLASQSAVIKPPRVVPPGKQLTIDTVPLILAKEVRIFTKYCLVARPNHMSARYYLFYQDIDKLQMYNNRHIIFIMFWSPAYALESTKERILWQIWNSQHRNTGLFLLYIVHYHTVFQHVCFLFAKLRFTPDFAFRQGRAQVTFAHLTCDRFVFRAVANSREPTWFGRNRY